MIKRISSLLLCAVMFISAAAWAAAEDIASEIINPEIVTTMTITPRLKSNVAAKVGDKTVLYGLAHNSGGLYAFDVSDDQNAIQLGSVIAVTAYDNKEAMMYVKDGHLIFANGNNVQINELNADGSVGTQRFSNETGGVVASMTLKDNLLFAASENKNNGVTVYDVSDPSATVLLGKITAENSVRNVAVEKISDVKYRAYIIVKANVDGTPTVKLAIEDITYEAGDFITETIFSEAVPSYEGLGWLSYGYTTTDSALATVIKSGYISVEGNNSVRVIVDVTDPTAPAVIAAEAVTNASFRYRKLNLDSAKLVEINKNSNGISIMDYTDIENPVLLASVTTLSGEGASILGNYLYITTNGKISKVKLYDGYTVNEPVVNKKDDSITVSVSVDNHISQEADMVLIAAIYRDDKMIGTEFLADTVPANEKNFEFSVDLEVSGEAEYSFKTWMFDNFYDMTLLSEVAY